MKRIILGGMILGFLPAAIYVGMTAGFRMEMVSFGAIYNALAKWLGTGMAVGSAVLLVTGVLGLISRNISLGVLSLVLAAGSGAVVYKVAEMKSMGEDVPPIHDITTDTIDPPAFTVTAAERKETDRPAAYDAKQTASQIQAYPDLEPIVVTASLSDAFDAALGAMKSSGIAVKAEDREAGMIEGTATTAWFGFKDDVVIRVRPGEGAVVVIDIRSKSRVGRSDLGANAARIRVLRDAILKQVDAA